MTMPAATNFSVKIFIGNLSPEANADDIRPLFENYGTVVECDILRSYGFVHMSNTEEADAAIQALNGTEVKGKNITVQLSTGDKTGSGNKNKSTVKLFVGNLVDNIADADLRPLFEEFGTVTECAVLKSYGFIHMDDPEAAKLAIRALNGHVLKGKSMSVEFSTGQSTKRVGGDFYEWYPATNKRPRPAPTKLFVGNLAEEVTNEELKPLFEKYGSVVECDVLKSYGFVHMDNPDAATEAIKNLNGFQLHGRVMSVERSTSTVRQKPGMGGGNMCFKCGARGHWSKDCPRERRMGPPGPPPGPPRGPPGPPGHWRDPNQPMPPPPRREMRDMPMPPPHPGGFMRDKYVGGPPEFQDHLYDRYERYLREYERYMDYMRRDGYDRPMPPAPGRDMAFNSARNEIYTRRSPPRPPMMGGSFGGGGSVGMRDGRMMEGGTDFTRDPMLPPNRSFGGVDRLAPVSYPAPLRRPL